MFFLVAEIFGYLVVTLLLGLIGGWVIRGLRYGESSRASEVKWRARVEEAEALREKYRADKEAAEKRLHAAQSSLDDSEGRRELQLAELASLRADLSGLGHTDDELAKYRSDVLALKQQLRTANDAVNSYRSQLELKARETAEYRIQYEKALQSNTALKKEFAESEHRQQSIETNDSSTTDQMLTELEELLGEREARISELEGLLRASDNDAAHLRDHSAMSEAQLKAVEAQLTDLQAARKAAAGSASTELSRGQNDVIGIGTSTEAALLRSELAERTRKLAVVEADYRALKAENARLAEIVSDAELPESELSTSAQVSSAPAWIMESPPVEPDDLKTIRGIGPVIERTLNEIGVYYFHQIARFERRDIEWVAEQIGTFPKRIVQDRWVEQASKLSAGKEEA